MSKKPYTNPKHQQNRNAAIGKIHIAKSQLGLDDETYRAILLTIGNVKSSKDLTPEGINKVIKHFESKGVVFTKKKGTGQKPNNLNKVPQLQKIEALLADMKLPWDYLTSKGQGNVSMLQRLTGKQRLEFCDQKGLTSVITALTKKQQGMVVQDAS